MLDVAAITANVRLFVGETSEFHARLPSLVFPCSQLAIANVVLPFLRFRPLAYCYRYFLLLKIFLTVVAFGFDLSIRSKSLSNLNIYTLKITFYCHVFISYIFILRLAMTSNCFKICPTSSTNYRHLNLFDLHRRRRIASRSIRILPLKKLQTNCNLLYKLNDRVKL